MAQSSIEWTEKSWNVTTGCTKFGDECKFCYAEKETKRLMNNPNFTKYSQGFDVVVEHEDTLKEPYKWKKPSTIFVDSMSDLFHKDVSLEFIKKVFKVMNETPQHTYQVLTKRAKNLVKYSHELEWSDNIWAGVSVGNQKATERIESLVKCDAKHKFLSIEPFIEEITDINLKGIDWVIVGGESGGNGARPLKKEWVLKIQEECSKKDVPFFFKQWGKTRNNPDQNDPTINDLHKYRSKGGSQLNGKSYRTNPTIPDDRTPPIKLFGEEYEVMDNFDDLVTIWELKSHLPFSDKDLYEKLKLDIQKNGLNDPILYFLTADDKKLVIEGHTRLRALIKLKRKNIQKKEIKESFGSLEDIKFWMVKHQLQRRNLTKVERLDLAFLSKPTIEKLAKENLSKAGKSSTKNGAEKDSPKIQPIDTNEEIAKIAGVGRTTVTRYSRLREHASKTTLNKLNKGDISIGSAYDTIKDKIEKKDLNKKKPIQPKANEILELSDYSEGESSMEAGDIDAILIVRNQNDMEAIKMRTKLKIGVVKLEKELTFDTLVKP